MIIYPQSPDRPQVLHMQSPVRNVNDHVEPREFDKAPRQQGEEAPP